MVDDDDDVRAYIVDTLRSLADVVVSAPSGPAAIKVLEQEGRHFDLLLTDVVMPEMSGRELAIRARKLRPDLRVRPINESSAPNPKFARSLRHARLPTSGS